MRVVPSYTRPFSLSFLAGSSREGSKPPTASSGPPAKTRAGIDVDRLTGSESMLSTINGASKSARSLGHDMVAMHQPYNNGLPTALAIHLSFQMEKK